MMNLLRRIWPNPYRAQHRLGLLRQYSPRPLAHSALPSSDLPSHLPPPRICLVTPSFQQGNFLEATLKSVLDQNYPRLDYGVQDGGSTDGTTGILSRYQNQLRFAQSGPDQGQTSALIRGFNHLEPSPEDLMAWLNSDDLLLPGTLSLVAGLFLSHPSVDVIYGHRIIIDEKGDEIGRWILPEHDPEVLRWVDFIPQETLFFRASAYQKIGGLDPRYQFAMDWDLLLRFQESGCRFMRANQFLGCFRVHPHQKTSTLLHSDGEKEMQRLRERSLKGRFHQRIFDRIFWREVRRSRSAARKLPPTGTKPHRM